MTASSLTLEEMTAGPWAPSSVPAQVPQPHDEAAAGSETAQVGEGGPVGLTPNSPGRRGGDE